MQLYALCSKYTKYIYCSVNDKCINDQPNRGYSTFMTNNFHNI